MVTMQSDAEGVSIRFSCQVGIGVTYENFFVNSWISRHKNTIVLLLFKRIYWPPSIQTMAVMIYWQSDTYCQQPEHMHNHTYIDWWMLGRRGYDIIEWWIPYEKIIQTKRVPSFVCILPLIWLIFHENSIYNCVWYVQQYHSQKLINWILAGFCTYYQYASTFSYNIFMSAWNHMEFEVSCKSISWSTETIE